MDIKAIQKRADNAAFSLSKAYSIKVRCQWTVAKINASFQKKEAFQLRMRRKNLKKQKEDAAVNSTIAINKQWDALGSLFELRFQ